jgi:hypothetical protein
VPASLPCPPAIRRRTNVVGVLVSLAIVLSVAPAAVGKTYHLSPRDNWFDVIAGDRLRPGDEVVLHAGVYSDPRRLSLRHRGSDEAPIVIRGADGEQATFRRPDAKQNSLNLKGVRQLVLRNFEITGGAAGIRVRPHDGVQPEGIVLEGLHIHHVGGVAVTCNHPGGDYSEMTFRRNHIHHTSGHGEGFYLGGNNATAIIHGSVIEYNYIHDLDGEEISQGDGIEIKQGSYGNRIRGNVVHDTNFPGIIVYGTAGRDQNQITDNLIWNSGDHGIQAAADAVIRGNAIAKVRGAGIYSRTHQGAVPGNLQVENNIVVVRAPARAIRIIRPDEGSPANDYSGSVVVSGNQLFAFGGVAASIDASPRVQFRDNRGVGMIRGLDSSTARLREAELPALQLPELGDHPAWRFLERDEVRQRFLSR